MIVAKVQVELDKMLAAGILRRSYSAWASPIVAIVKNEGSIRINVNYKRLNECTVVPVLPVPVRPNKDVRGLHPAYCSINTRFVV